MQNIVLKKDWHFANLRWMCWCSAGSQIRTTERTIGRGIDSRFANSIHLSHSLSAYAFLEVRGNSWRPLYGEVEVIHLIVRGNGQVSSFLCSSLCSGGNRPFGVRRQDGRSTTHPPAHARSGLRYPHRDSERRSTGSVCHPVVVEPVRLGLHCQRLVEWCATTIRVGKRDADRAQSCGLHLGVHGPRHTGHQHSHVGGRST